MRQNPQAGWVIAVPAASFLFAVVMSWLASAAGAPGRTLRAAADETSQDGGCRGNTHSKKDSKEIEIGDKKYSFGRDIEASGRICRFDGFGIKLASVDGHEDNTVILFNKREKLYSVKFNGINVNGAASASLKGHIGKNNLNSRANGALVVDNSVTVETDVSADPVFSKKIDVVGKPVNLRVTVPITVKPEVTLETNIEFSFPANGVDAVGNSPAGGHTALKSSVSLPVTKGIPVVGGNAFGFTLKVEVELNGQLKYSGTRYVLDAHPRANVLNGTAESIFDGLNFKMGGKVRGVLGTPFGDVGVDIFPEGEFFDIPLEGSTQALY